VKDVMKDLAAARPAHLSGEDQVEENVRTAELSRAFAQPRSTVRRRRRLVVPILVGGVGAVTAVALAVGMGGKGPGRSPTWSPAPAVQSVFLTAADRAELLPTGKYWYTDQIWGQSYLVKGGYAITGAHWETFEWTAVKAGGGNLFYGRDLPAKPLTRADEAAWRKAGSPSSFRVWSNDHYGTYTTKAGRWDADHPQAKEGGTFSIPGSKAPKTVAELQDLPTDPAELGKIFFGPPPTKTGGLPSPEMAKWFTDPAHVVLNAGEAFGGAPLPPKVRAGLMRALAAQPGVQNLGTVIDPLGRRGVAIGADWSDARPTVKDGKPAWEPMGYRSREELIFDVKTGEYLGDQQILTRPGGEYRTRKPGFVINYRLERGSGWTNKKPSPPKSLPFSSPR
jgi:hypothetical protein